MYSYIFHMANTMTILHYGYFKKSAPATSLHPNATYDSSRSRKPPARQRNCCVVDPAPKVPGDGGDAVGKLVAFLLII